MHKIHKIHAFNDNFIWAISGKTGSVTIVDPGDAKPVLTFLQENSFQLSEILITHHHPDHLGGVAELLKAFPTAVVYGPDTARFKKVVTTPVDHDDDISLISCGLNMRVVSLPGHTLDHVGYLNSECTFVGDTLFSAGCGRLFEGSAKQMYDSLSLLMDLEDDTPIYCAHEYTVSNLNFALAVEPNNDEIVAYLSDVTARLERNESTVPTTMKVEKRINPFLRTNNKAVQEQVREYFSLGELPNPVECFAYVRKWKDSF